MFTTDRLHLRAYEPSDAQRLLDLWNNPHVQPTVSNEYIVPRGPKYMEKLVSMADESILFVIIETKNTAEFVGTSSIAMSHPKNRDGIFGIMLLPKFWNKGYGTEVTNFMVDYSFHSLGLHRVSLGVYAGNQRAVELYKRIGFIEEGRKRQTNWIAGHWEDMISMGILEEEWSRRKRS